MSGAYDSPVTPKYQDNAAADEGEARFAHEFSRQRLYARGQMPQRPAPMWSASASQEAYEPPAERRPETLQRVPASCATCQGTLACPGGDGPAAYCLTCNEAALAPERGVPSMIK